MIVMAVHEFAAQRRGDQDTMEKEIYPEVSEALQHYPATNWQAPLLSEATRLYLSTYHKEGGKGRPAGLAGFIRDVRDTLDKTENPTDATADRVSVWLSTAILNAATQDAAGTDEEFLLMEWVTMHDADVRPEHAAAAGQQRPTDEPYDVGGVKMRYPGDPRAPIELWINCRCTLAPVLASEAHSTQEGVTMTATETEPNAEPEQMLAAPLAWHGVLAPEGIWSGDGRQFAPDSLRFRDLPLPLTWQKATDSGHDGSVVVGKINTIERANGMMNATGTFLATPEADEVVGLLAEFGKFGVSVDADDAEFEFSETDEKITFTSARIASASIVAIPAFAEAYITLGNPVGEFADQMPPSDEEQMDPCDEESPAYDAEKCAQQQQDDVSANAFIAFVDEGSWDGSAGRYTPAQWKSACVLHVCTGDEKSCHKLPIKTPSGALSRAGVHAAAARFNQVDAPPEAKSAAKARLRSAYSQLGEEVPDVLKGAATTETFDRGPGWVTNPEDTRRIHDYWTKPGEPGYQKINWGMPGDFNRCRTLVGEKIAENSPDKVRFLNQICSQWHHDALGYWPGTAPSEKAGDMTGMVFTTITSPTFPTTWTTTTTAPVVTLVASTGPKGPAAWFTNPELSGPTHLTVTEDGRVFGHIAEWSACHIGYEGVCVAPPTSTSGYAYFATGSVLLDNGSTARTGVISLGGGHARDRLRINEVTAHYDSTSTAVADVCVGEDEHGIWCAGWVRPGTPEENVVALRASDVSGDWREIGSNGLELVAALAVNVGGFPTVTVGVENGMQVSLCAAGAIRTKSEDEVIEQIAEKVEQALAARNERRVQMSDIANRWARRNRMRELAQRFGKEE